jgi:hypothetical protein
VFPHLAGVPLRAFHLDASACAHAFRASRPRLRELFGPDIPIPACHCPPVTYGHLACLGARVLFPENGAPAVHPICSSVEEGIRLLKRKVHFERNDLYRKHVALQSRLQREFPEEHVSFSGFGRTGPVTSAVLLRGQDFLLDLYDHPEQAKLFLELLTRSLIEFERFRRRIAGQPAVSSAGAGLPDDHAALAPPKLWPEFVLPCWQRYYSELTTGPRSLHCEGLTPAHLPQLKGLGLASFDPDRSPALTPAILAGQLGVPFAWSLQSYEYPSMTADAVAAWVGSSFAGGASRVYSHIYVNMLDHGIPAKVRAFAQAAGELARNPRRSST